MANRDVGVSICGVVVGVLIGAGSVLYAQDASLSASTTEVAYRGQDIEGAEAFSARHVEDRARDAVRNANLEDAPRFMRDDGSDEAEESAPVDMSACAVATRILDRMHIAIDTTIPDEQTNRYESIRNALGVVVANIRNDYCGAAPTEVEDMRPAAVEMEEEEAVDNDCEQYEGSPLQQTKCEANESQGLQFIGR